MIEIKQGDKGPNDKKVFVNGYQISYIELANITLQLYKNEDNLYPPGLGFRGGEMLLDFVTEVCRNGGLTEEIQLRYKL